MARPLRIEFPGAWYHIINRGNNQQEIFLSKKDYLNFLKLLHECFSMWALECHAYCLMPNHYHLLVSTPRGNLSRTMRHLDGVYTQRFNKNNSRDGHLFRGRYKAILVDEDSYLLQVARYIHLNPVQANLVRLPEDYPWSSYPFYLYPEKKPRALITQRLLELFGSGEKAIEQMRKFTEAGIDNPTRDFYKAERQSPILGSQEFIQRIKKEYLGDKAQDKEIPKSEKIINPPSLNRVIYLVAQAYEINPDSICSSSRGNFNEPRHVAIYLARHLAASTLPEIGKRFGPIGYSAVSNVCCRLETGLHKDQTLEKRLRELEGAIRQDSVKNSKGVFLELTSDK